MQNLVKKVLSTNIGRYFVKRGVTFVEDNFFKELNIKINAENNIIVPLCFRDSTSSFSEIFVFKEYKNIKRNIKKWIDLGSNNGFFSLFIASQTPICERKNLQALLIDGDKRSLACLKEIQNLNKNLDGLKFELGIISRGSGEIGFKIKEHMFSKIEKESQQKVKILTQEQILAKISPPFDLIKVDIEGSEVDFIYYYPKVLKNTKALIIEWHSWNSCQVTNQDFKKLLFKSGFSKVSATNPRNILDQNRKKISCLTFFAHR
jgi:FkbM family methyltransferase